MTSRTLRFITTTAAAIAITGGLVVEQAIAGANTGNDHSHQSLLIKADTLFDGTQILDNTGSGWAVLVRARREDRPGRAGQPDQGPWRPHHECVRRHDTAGLHRHAHPTHSQRGAAAADAGARGNHGAGPGGAGDTS
jgi:hypothetical protein